MLQIFSAERRQDGLVLDGALYIRRMSVPDVSKIRLSAFLLNEQTGKKKDLPLEQTVLSEEWADREDGEGRYDYRGTGIRLNLRTEDLDDPQMAGDNRLMIRYRTDAGSGVKILTGLRKQMRRKLKRSGLTAGRQTVSFSADELGTLNIRIEEKTAETDRKKTEKTRSSPKKNDVKRSISQLQKLVLEEDCDRGRYRKLVRRVRTGAAKALRGKLSLKKRLKYAAYALAPDLMLTVYRMRHRH